MNRIPLVDSCWMWLEDDMTSRGIVVTRVMFTKTGWLVTYAKFVPSPTRTIYMHVPLEEFWEKASVITYTLEQQSKELAPHQM